MAPSRIWTRVTTGALALGVVHALVDAACGFVIFQDLRTGPYSHEWVVGLVVLYNTLAFGGQSLAGLAADRLGNYRGMGVAGAVLAVTALLVGPSWTVVAIVLVGVGNALFHVGAGADVLRSSEDRATESGIFVGPGAVGLCAGIWLGGHDVPCRMALAVALLVTAPLMLPVARATMPRITTAALPRARSGLILLAVLGAAFLVSSVTVRALIGGTVAGTWRGTSTEVMVALAVAACCGKMIGGFVGDRLGWITTCMVALFVSAPLVSVLVGNPAGAVVGMLVFQMTMAITLKATHHAMPDRPGLAFGLPCLALLFGALPGLLGFGVYFQWWPLVVGMLAVTAVVIGVGLGMLTSAGVSTGPAKELPARLLAR